MNISKSNNIFILIFFLILDTLTADKSLSHIKNNFLQTLVLKYIFELQNYIKISSHIYVCTLTNKFINILMNFKVKI
jgi:hypothetical protein